MWTSGELVHTGEQALDHSWLQLQLFQHARAEEAVMIFSVRTWCSSVWISSVGTVEHPAWPQLVGPRLETSGLLEVFSFLPG